MKKLFSRLLGVMLPVVVIAGVLAACVPATPQPGDGTTDVLFLPLVGDWNAYQVLADAFNSQHAGVRVTVASPYEIASLDPALPPAEAYILPAHHGLCRRASVAGGQRKQTEVKRKCRNLPW